MAKRARDVYARVWSTVSYTRKFGFQRTWHYEVVVGVKGTVILYDNTGDYDKMLRAALIRVEALRHMVVRGHPLKEYKAHR